ncbi:MAG: RNAase [Bacteroidia bacterium]|nr:RNAase [Bacteroidia bacterium]
MTQILSRDIFFVKEHVGMFKAANNYDILDPETKDTILHCREENLGALTKMFRFTDYKRMTPFDVRIKTVDGQQVVRVNRGVAVLASKVKVFDENDVYIGGFKQKVFSLGGKFIVHDQHERDLFMLTGKWSGWDFKFTAGDVVLAEVTKKWAGLGKELFTSADNYILKISPDVPADAVARKLILASVMCIDMVLKE